MLIQSPGLYCFLHDRLINQERFVGTRNSNFIYKARRLKRWWTTVPKNHVIRVRIQAPFILKGEGPKSDTPGFPAASGAGV